MKEKIRYTVVGIVIVAGGCIATRYVTVQAPVPSLIAVTALLAFYGLSIGAGYIVHWLLFD